MRKVLFCGGGTGGHIYPALAIRETLLEHFPDLDSVYMGVKEGMEAGIVSRLKDLPFLPIRAQGMPREFNAKWLSFPWVNLAGFVDALLQVRKFSPHLVVATGGYVSFPVLLASWFLGVPFAIHEQNAAMGVTNRLFAKKAARVLLTYPEAYAEKSEKVVVTGNPVRRAFISGSPKENRFDKKPGEFWILVVGGSRGATSLNKLCAELSATWLAEHPEVRLLHITGERDFEAFKGNNNLHPNHMVLPYLHEMREGFEVADLLISRAGATILAEIGKCGKPAILVPFPFATDNHQEKNARALEHQGAAKVLLDKDLTVATFSGVFADIRKKEVLAQLSANMLASRPNDVEDRIFRALSPLLQV